MTQRSTPRRGIGGPARRGVRALAAPGEPFPLPAETAGVVSEAERAIGPLNSAPQPALRRWRACSCGRSPSPPRRWRACRRTPARSRGPRRGGTSGPASEPRCARSSPTSTPCSSPWRRRATRPRIGLEEIRLIHAGADGHGHRLAPVAGRIRDRPELDRRERLQSRAAPTSCPRRPRHVGRPDRRPSRRSSIGHPAAAGAGGHRPRAVRDHPPLRGRERPDGPGAHPRRPAPPGPDARVHPADQRRPRPPARAYIEGLIAFREDRVSDWVDHFAAAAAESARLATSYLAAVGRLQEAWRERLRAARHGPPLGRRRVEPHRGPARATPSSPSRSARPPPAAPGRPSTRRCGPWRRPASSSH